jgi:hypothetical protein
LHPVSWTSEMAKTEQKSPRIAVAVALLWRSLTRDLFSGYRPELHYMRGPGPKWHAKHESLPSNAAAMTAAVADAVI